MKKHSKHLIILFIIIIITFFAFIKRNNSFVITSGDRVSGSDIQSVVPDSVVDVPSEKPDTEFSSPENIEEDNEVHLSQNHDNFFDGKPLESFLINVQTNRTDYGTYTVHFRLKNSELTPNNYDVLKNIQYLGKSYRVDEPVEKGVAMIYFDATNENVRLVDRMLSSLEIPYNIMQTSLGPGWSNDPRISGKISIAVSAKNYQRAASIIVAGLNMDLFEKVNEE